MKRGQSGKSLVCPVFKPKGMTSHDVVNAARRAFGEKRIGHGGTLDPMAEGVLILLVGPATRLNRYIEGHDKRYLARISFGVRTDTDDAEGETIRTANVPSEVFDPAFAEEVLKGFLGPQMQMPPIYSAIKKDGVKAYEAARKGKVVNLEPRPIEVFSADLVDIGADGPEAFWDVRFKVSKGTYIRALARDIGHAAGTEAHLSALMRESIGAISLDRCVSLDALPHVLDAAAIDPVEVLGLRFMVLQGDAASALANGAAMKMGPELGGLMRATSADACACMGSSQSSDGPLVDGELVCMVADNKLKAIYRYEQASVRLVPECVFPDGVIRSAI